jgi:hypothetical protein
MKAVLALIVIYIGAFLIATQGSSQNTTQPAKQGLAAQTASIDPTKEADIRSLMELVGARDSLQELAARGAEQFRENLTASVSDNDRDAATGQLEAIYDKHFTDDEIKGLLQFYGSPLGQKFAAEMPKINIETQAASRAFSTRIAKEVLQDLRKQYPGVAAHARLAKPRPNQAEPPQQLAQTQP